MVNVNKNSALEVLEGLVQKSFNSYINNSMPESFSEKQQMAFDLFKQRIFLEEVIEESISFNKSLVWDDSHPNLKLTTTAEELIEVFKLRSDVYTEINYQGEFPDTIEGLNFDKFDKKSAILYCSCDHNVTGTLKVVFDSRYNLPSEDKLSFERIRSLNSKIVELSRFVIKNLNKGLNQEFKYLFEGVYILYNLNNIDLVLSGIKKDHYKLYSKFGGVNIEKEMANYGNVNKEALILSWNPAEISPFFKRAFLGIK